MSTEDTGVGRELANIVINALRDQGRELRTASAELADFAAERAAHLETFVGQPGFEEAVQAEADRIALRAAGEAVKQADEADTRLVSIIASALKLAARVAS